MSDTPEKLLVRDTEAAKMLDMGRSTFWEAVRKKLLPEPMKIGGLTRWRVSDLRRVDPAAVRAKLDARPIPILRRRPRSVPLAPGVHHLYRHFDAEGRLLYVGISFSALHRLSEHKERSAWFWQIARVEVTGYRSRKAAALAEMVSIQKEKPLHNLVWAVRKAA